MKTIDDFALVGIGLKPIPTEAVIRAVMAQTDHYRAPEVDALPALAGVELCDGWGILCREGAAGIDRLPPGFERRQCFVDRVHAVFYPYLGRPLSETSQGPCLTRSSIQEDIERAVERWSEPHEDRRMALRVVPWAMYYETDPAAMVNRTVAEFVSGRAPGCVAVALGRLNKEDVIAVEETRWVFPIGGVPR